MTAKIPLCRRFKLYSRRRFFVMGLLALSGLVQAQSLVTPNPADLLDARLSLINPAAAAMQDPLFTAGLQALHTGVGDNAFDFRNNFFGLTATDRSILGWKNFALGLQAQVLTTPVMNDLAFNALLSRKITDQFSAGISLGPLNRSFSNFDSEGLDPNDPLLRNTSQWAPFSLNAGILYKANRYLKLGAVANRLNNPNLAFQEGGVARVSRYLGVGAIVGFNSFTAGLGFAHESHKLSSQVFLQYFHLERGYAKVGYSTENLALEGQLHVTSGVSFNYRYNYPLNDLNIASSGSHELGLIFNFRKRPLPYEPEWLKPAVPLPDPIAMVDLFEVSATRDEVTITDTHITREVDADVSARERADLPRGIFYSATSVKPEPLGRIFLADSTAANGQHAEPAVSMLEKLTAENRAAGRVVPKVSVPIIKEMEKSHTKAYMVAFTKLAEQLHDSTFRATIIVPPEAHRAELILRYMMLTNPALNNLFVIRADSAKARQQNYLGADEVKEKDFERKLNVPGTMFNFTLKDVDQPLRWGPMSGKFVIEDATGKVWYDSTVAHRKSKNVPPQILELLLWDWTVNTGDPQDPYLQAGHYYYYVVWKSADGSTYRSPKRRIAIDRRPERVHQKLRKKLAEKVSPDTEATIRLNQ